MDEAERKRKIEEGKQKLANFVKKKGKRTAASTKLESNLPVQSQMASPNSTANSEIKGKENMELLSDKDDPDWSLTQNVDVILSYGQKIQKFQQALQKRDSIITQLSDRLESTIEAQSTVQSEGAVQAEALAREINMLKLQLQEATEVLGSLNSKNGISAQELLEARNQVIFLEEQSYQKDAIIEKQSQRLNKLENELLCLQETNTQTAEKTCAFESNIGDQTDFIKENRIIEQSQNYSLGLSKDALHNEVGTQVDLNEIDFNRFTGAGDLDEQMSLDDLLLQYQQRENLSSLEYTLISQFQLLVNERNELRVKVNKLEEQLNNLQLCVDTEQISTEINVQNINSLNNTQQELINDSEKSLNKILKRLACLNVIAKIVESLLNLPAKSSNLHSVNEQNRSQNRLSSGEIVDLNSTDFLTLVPQEMGNCLSDKSSLNMQPISKLLTQHNVSYEGLRHQDLKDSLADLNNFLCEEMNSCSQLQLTFDDSKSSNFNLTIDGTNANISSSRNSDNDNSQGSATPVNSEGAVSTENSPDLKFVYESIALQKASLQCSLQRFQDLEQDLQKVCNYKRSFETDSLADSENIFLEEMPSSCLSLVSITDNENRPGGTNVVLDSRRDAMESADVVSNEHSKSLHENVKPPLYSIPEESVPVVGTPKSESQILLGDLEMFKERNQFTINEKEKQVISSNYEKYIQELKAKHEYDIIDIKETLENSYNTLNTELLEKIKNLEHQKSEFETSKEVLECKLLEEKELLLSDNIKRVQQLIDKHAEEITNLKNKLEGECNVKERELLVKIGELEENLLSSKRGVSDCIEAKLKVECYLQNQIADLVQEHQQDLETLKKDGMDSLNKEKKRLEKENLATVKELNKLHQGKINEIKDNFCKGFEEEKKNLIEGHHKALAHLEARHSDEINSYQRKVENLLEEKCQLLTKSGEEFEKIITRNHQALESLCRQLQKKISEEKEKLQYDANKSTDCNLETSFSDTLDDLSRKIQRGVDIFLRQKYFTDEPISAESEEQLQNALERLAAEDFKYKTQIDEMQNIIDDMKEKHQIEISILKKKHAEDLENLGAHSIESTESNEIQNLMISEIDKLQEEFAKDIAIYKDANEKLAEELQHVRNQLSMLEDHKLKLEEQLKETESQTNDSEKHRELDSSSVRGRVTGSQLSSTDIRSWQFQAAQTNSRLLHVLSALVKTFLDIENDINSHLMEYGLIVPNSENISHHDDDTAQSVGSREDFTALSIGESPNQELTEDGPDLTPRAWDLFTSIGTYDADTEGEDVVIGASRRVRSAVDHVLLLLSHVFSNQENQDIKVLLKRNEELSQDLQEESHGKDSLQIDLVNAESVIRKYEGEKLKLEDVNFHLLEEKETLIRELNSLKNRMMRLEEEKETAYEEKKQLREHCDIMASRLGDPEQKLLQQNTQLSTEKRTIQKQLSKERQSLLSRLHQLELALEEVTAEKEDLIERKRKEVEDLKAQMEAMEKQLQSNKKFIEEQALEREQEREEYYKEISKLNEFVREKDKIQNIENQLTREVESLEQSMKAKIEDHKVVIIKKEELERELRQAVDKVHDLRDVIRELEKQLDLKSRSEVELKKKLTSVYESLSVHVKSNADLKNKLEECNDSTSSKDSIEQLRVLEEHLASRTQELEQMSQSETLLQELRGQIHFLEAKVDQRTRQLEAMHLVTLSTSPVPSDDTSHSESQDGELHHVPCEDGWEMSPRSIHWIEIRRLEEKIGRLTHMEEELIKQNKDLDLQLRKIKMSEDELHHEKIALQEQLTEQLLKISALKSHIDEQRHRAPPTVTAQALAELEELRETLEREIELRRRATSDFQDVRDQLKAVQEELREKTETVATLQKIQQAFQSDSSKDKPPKPSEVCQVSKQMSSTKLDKNCFPPYIQLLIKEKNEHIDNLTNQLHCLQEEIDGLQKENARNAALGSTTYKYQLEDKDVEELKREKEGLATQLHEAKARVTDLEGLLEASQGQVEMEKIQVETLIEEMGSLTKSQSKKPKHEIQRQIEAKEKEILELCIEKENLSKQLHKMEEKFSKSEEEVAFLMSRITELQETSLKAKEQMELEQQQLEKDFDTVQDMMQRKEKELHTLQEETENQLRLEAEIDTLQQSLDEQKVIEEKLYEKLSELQKELEDTKSAYVLDASKWKIQMEGIIQKYISEQELLQKQVFILQKKIAVPDEHEDIDLIQVKNNIIEAAQNLNGSSDDSSKLFEQIVLHILNQAVTFKVNQLQIKHKANIETVNKSWQNKVEELSNHKRFTEEKLEKEKCALSKKYKEEIEAKMLAMTEKFELEKERLFADKDKYWQEKLKQIESSLKGDHESVKKLITEEFQLQEQVSRKVEEVKQVLEEMHHKEISKMKDTITKLTKEKDAAYNKCKQEVKNKEEAIKFLHEKEKTILLKEFESKFCLFKDQLKSKFSNQKQELEASYQSQICELQKALNSKLEEERENIQLRRKEELNSLHGFFEKRWEDEMKKFHHLHQEELNKLKECKDKNVDDVCNRLFSLYEGKLKKMQNECEQQISEERNQNFTQHQAELQKLQQVLEEKFNKETQSILELKEKQVREELGKKYDKEFLEKFEALELENLANNIKILEENWQKKWENEEKKLRNSHKTELVSLKHNFQGQLERQLDSQLKAHQEELKRLDYYYSHELQNARQALNDAKIMQSQQLSAAFQTLTSSSEVNASSDDSSCQGDLMPSNKQLLVNKIQKEGKQVLSLIQSKLQQQYQNSTDSKEYFEEREWIIDKLKSVSLEMDNDGDNLKYSIHKLVEEIHLSRKKLDSYQTQNEKLKVQVLQLQYQLNSQSGDESPNSDLIMKLDQQLRINSQLEAMLLAAKTELDDLRQRSLRINGEQPHQYIERNGNLSAENIMGENASAFSTPAEVERLRSGDVQSAFSTPAEVEQLRSGDIQRSAEKFSIHLPEIIDTPPVLVRTTSDFEVKVCDRCASTTEALVKERAKWVKKLRKAQELSDHTEDENAQLKQQLQHLMIVQKNRGLIASTETKLHHLYWKYRRSQSYQKALVFQKKYLLTLLSGFQATEEVTLGMLAHMGVSISRRRDLSSTSSVMSNQPLKGCSLFRSAVYVIVALSRMRFLVKHWQRAAVVPPSFIIEKEVDSTIRKLPFASPETINGSQSMSYSSTPSRLSSSPSVEDIIASHRRGSKSSIFSRNDQENTDVAINMTPSRGQLMEYVNRLETLHQQLGLNSLDES